MVRIAIDEQKIAKFCNKHQVKKLAFFGSVLRKDFRPGSDVDVLIEFDPEKRVGFEFFSMQEELSQILNRKVDLHTPAFLSRYFRDKVLREAEVHYDRT